MKGLSLAFFISGVVSVVLGMIWGIVMSASQDHLLAPAHAHLNLLGWVSFSIYAFYYHLVPNAGQGLLPRLHFALAVGGLLVLVPGIVMAITGQGEILAKLGSVLSLGSMLLFLWIVIRSVRHPATTRARGTVAPV